MRPTLLHAVFLGALVCPWGPWMSGQDAEQGPSLESEIASALKSMPSWAGENRLLELIDHGNIDQKTKVLDQLGQRRNTAARGVVMKYIAHPDKKVALAALDAARLLGPDSHADDQAVAKHLTSDDAQLRRGAIACLGAWGDQRDVPGLIARLSDTDPANARAATEALTAMTGQHLGSDPVAWTAWNTDEQARAGKQLDEFAEQLHSKDPNVVVGAIRHLAQMRGHLREAGDLVAPLVKDEDQAIAAAAQIAMPDLNPNYVVPEGLRVSAPAVNLPPPPRAVAPSAPMHDRFLIPVVVLGILLLAGGYRWLRSRELKTVSSAAARAGRVAPSSRPGPGFPTGKSDKGKPSAARPSPAKPAGSRSRPEEKIFKLD